ncbi:MAG: CotH kinase family protein [Anaerolineae bacterium]|nr:CotH kinase family protein [Anaerolineae bacterium]
MRIHRDGTERREKQPGVPRRFSLVRGFAWTTVSVLMLAGVALLASVFWQGAPVTGAPVTGAPAPVAPAPVAPVTAPTPTPQSTPMPTSRELGDALDTLYIDIEPQDFAQIEAKRAEALERWILLTGNDDLVPATLRLGEQNLPVRLRLKGDWADHVAHDKWSFRIETRDESYLYGMQVFSIQDPSMRTYLHEYAFLENLRQEGLLSVHYDFVRVVLNGKAMGIYALEEGFAKELLESQERREGVIIRYSEDLLWTARAFYDDQVIPAALEKFFVIDDFESGRIDKSPTLSAERDTAIGLLRGYLTGDLTAAEVFDLEQLGKFLALTDLWSAPHGLIWHNLRYYYNPITARLEPIAFDADPFSPELNFEQVGLPLENFYSDPLIQAAYVQALAEVSQPEFVDALEATLGPRYEALRGALEPEFGAEVLTPPWDWLRRRQELNRQRLDPIQTTYAYRARAADLRASAVPTTTLVSEDLVLEVGNLLDLPVEVVGVRVDGEELAATRAWVSPEMLALTVPPLPMDPDALVLPALPPDAAALPYVRLQLPVTAPPTANVELLTRLWGLAATEPFTQTVLPSYPLPLGASPRPTAPTLAEALARYPYLQPADEGMVTIPSGAWEIGEPLVLPAGYGLRLGPGVTLRFAPEAYLLSEGPLVFEGTAGAPVRLQPIAESWRAESWRAESWRGIAVLEAGAPSTWDYVTVEATDALARDGWLFTGAITFFRSPVTITHSRILGTRAEDALNIYRTHFYIADSEFANTASDAFDGDFVEGLFERCVFHDIAADGIDVSGSNVTVRQVRFLNLGDKGLSVGEGSTMQAEDIFVEGADYGLASKDRSHLTATRITLNDIAIAGLAAYIKKPSYGPATITVTSIDFGNTPADRHALVQTRSWVDLDGVRIWGSDVDVEALYEKWPK